MGIFRRVLGVIIIIIGIALLVVFSLDDFTGFGIVNDIIPVMIIGYGAVVAVPGLRLPGFKMGGRLGKNLTKLLTIVVIGVVAVILALIFIVPSFIP